MTRLIPHECTECGDSYSYIASGHGFRGPGESTSSSLCRPCHECDLAALRPPRWRAVTVTGNERSRVIAQHEHSVRNPSRLFGNGPVITEVGLGLSRIRNGTWEHQAARVVRLDGTRYSLTRWPGEARWTVKRFEEEQ